MVTAPSIPHPAISDVTLRNAPLIYGGGGGKEIFSDIWVYDVDTSEWYQVTPVDVGATFSVISSLLFGSVGFALCACIVVCVFLRRLTRHRRGVGFMSDGPRVGPQGHNRGVPSQVVAELPRVRWCDVVKLTAPPVAKLVASRADANATVPVASEPAAAADVEGGTGDGGEDDKEVCPVCLMEYDDDDVLLRLPCEHLFHEDCISRWLAQDSSCPHCRFNLMGPAPPPPRPHDARPDDQERGTELVGSPLGAAPPTATVVAVVAQAQPVEA